jgi:hypothetical protein
MRVQAYLLCMFSFAILDYSGGTPELNLNMLAGQGGPMTNRIRAQLCMKMQVRRGNEGGGVHIYSVMDV